MSHLHPATYLQGGPLSPLAPLDAETYSPLMKTYRIYGTKDGQFVRIERTGVVEALKATSHLRALGWRVEVSS
jgi:hypothetical protein